MKVADVMTTPAITVPASAVYAEVVDTLVRRDVHSVPVLDGNGKLAGVISEGDVVRRGGHAKALGLLLDQLRGDESAWIQKATRTTARGLMTRSPRTVASDDDVVTAAAYMLDKDHHLLPVIDDHRCVLGVVTRRDVLRRFEADDAYIAAEIRDLLSDARSAPEGLNVKVAVLGGIVSVRGTTERLEDINLVQHVIARVSGVLAIRNDLSVRAHPGVATRSESPAWRLRRAGAGTR